jgi:hypothetical protein
LGLISFFLIFSPTRAQEISQCMNITQSGSYVVTQDLIIPSDRDTCIWINADNVVIDFQGHMIVRSSGDTRLLIGVRSLGYVGITIKNGAVIGIDYGIVLRGGGFIENMTVRSSNQIGIFITSESGKAISVKNSDVRYSYRGIHAEAWDNSDIFIENNNFESNDYTSVEISNIGSNVIFEIDKNRFVGNALEITASYGDVKSSISIYDNLFFSPNIRIDGRVASKVYFYIGVRKDGCYYNRLNGCGVGGNYWDAYSPNCQNNDKDSFCDYAYQVPVTEIITNYGITFYDYYPLASPQPYLCQQLQTNSINVYPTDSRTIEVYWNWYRSNIPSVTCSSPDSRITCSVDYSSCDFSQESGSCTAYLKITTNNVPVGDYQLTLETSSGSCNYVNTIYVHVTTAPCSGQVTLNIPSQLNISQYYTPSISGLSNCGGVAYFKQDNCYTATIRQCYVSGTGCSFGQLQAPSSPGTYTYCACFDKNGDGTYSSDEYDCESVQVSVFKTVTFTITIYDIRTIYTTAEPFTTGNYIHVYNISTGYSYEIFPNQNADPDGSYRIYNIPAGPVYRVDVSREGYRNATWYADTSMGWNWDIPFALTPIDNGAVYAYGYFPNGTLLPNSARYTLYFSNNTQVPSLHPLAENPVYGFGRWDSIPYGSYYVTVEYANYFGKSQIFTLDDTTPLVNLTIYTEAMTPTVWIDVYPKNITLGEPVNLTVYVIGLALPLDLVIKVKDPIVKDYLICKYETMTERNQTYEIPANCFRKGNITQDIKVWACWFGNCFESNSVSVAVAERVGLAPFPVTPFPGWEAFPLLNLQAMFFALSIGFSAGLEFLTRSKGIVFGIAFATMILFGCLVGVLPNFLIYVAIIIAALLFAGVMVKLIGGG